MAQWLVIGGFALVALMIMFECVICSLLCRGWEELRFLAYWTRGRIHDWQTGRVPATRSKPSYATARATFMATVSERRAA